MLVSVRGVYHKGKIELVEKAPAVSSAEVIVTFIGDGQGVDLRERGFTPQEIIELRERLSSFADDWNAPGMEVYDQL